MTVVLLISLYSKENMFQKIKIVRFSFFLSTRRRANTEKLTFLLQTKLYIFADIAENKTIIFCLLLDNAFILPNYKKSIIIIIKLLILVFYSNIKYSNSKIKY